MSLEHGNPIPQPMSCQCYVHIQTAALKNRKFVSKIEDFEAAVFKMLLLLCRYDVSETAAADVGT